MDAHDVLYHVMACLGKLTEVQMPVYHFSNFAVQKVPGEGAELIELTYSSEDSNVDDVPYAEGFAGLIEDLFPGQFVRITTGDYITADDVHQSFEHPEQETYDANYWQYLMPKRVFERDKAELERIDAEWREEKRKLANGEITRKQAVVDPFRTDADGE